LTGPGRPPGSKSAQGRGGGHRSRGGRGGCGGRSGREVSRSTKFGVDEVEKLLEVLSAIEPIGSVGWEEVARVYNAWAAEAGFHQRIETALKKQFDVVSFIRVVCILLSYIFTIACQHIQANWRWQRFRLGGTCTGDPVADLCESPYAQD
jgi:hypothetical protein